MTEVLTVPRIQAIKKLNFSLLLIEIQRTLKCLNDDKIILTQILKIAPVPHQVSS